MNHVIIATKGTRGDLSPFLSLAVSLKRRGHDVVFVSHCGYRQLIERVGLPFLPLDSPDEWEQYRDDIKLLNSPTGSALFFERHCLPRIDREFHLLKNICRPEHSILITRHAAILSDSQLARQLRLRLMRLFTSPSQVTLLPFLERMIGERYMAAFRDMCDGIGRSLRDPFVGMRGSEVVNIGAWPKWFGDGNTCLAGTLYEVGFIVSDNLDPGEVPADVTTFLNRGVAPLLITAGSAETVGADIYSIGQCASRYLGMECLVLMAKPPQYLNGQEGCLICPLLPFGPLIRRARAVLHHGGMGTISQAALAGVPQLVLPEGADRPDNAARVQQHALGLYVAPGARTAENVANALERMLSSEVISETCRKISMESIQIDSPSRVCELIESTRLR